MARKSRKKKDPKYGRRKKEEGKAGENGDPQKEGGLGEMAKSLAFAVVLFIVLRSFVLQTFVITSGSMEDTLLVGDFLYVNRLSVGSRVPFTQTRLPGYSEIRRGDVIVFDPHHEDDMKLVKRLVGLPGDTLQMVAGQLIRNGEELLEPYVKHEDPRGGEQFLPEMLWQAEFLLPEVDRSSYRPTRDTWGPLVVPQEHYFMLGDNRDGSLDSRFWGPLASWRVEGRAVFKYFSYDRGSVPFAFLRRVRWDRILDGIE